MFTVGYVEAKSVKKFKGFELKTSTSVNVFDTTLYSYVGDSSSQLVKFEKKVKLNKWLFFRKTDEEFTKEYEETYDKLLNSAYNFMHKAAKLEGKV